MNMAVASQIAVRTADLRDAHEVARIDDWLAEQDDATPFHRPAWSRGVERGCGQRAHYLLAENAFGAIAGVLPLTAMRSVLFGRALVSTGFGVDGGILARDARTTAALADAAWVLAERLSCPSVELRGGPCPVGDWASDDSRYLRFVRPLGPDDDAELLAIPRKQRAEVRRSLGFDLEVETGRSDTLAREHYAIYAESVRNLGTPVFPRALFAAMLAEFGGDADILVVRHQGSAVAAVLSLYGRGTVYPYWGGGTREARALRANDRMYYALMGHARSRGCTAFDFGRSKTGTGAAAFKANWGFEGRPLAYHHRVASGAQMREINPLDPKHQRKIDLWRKLPLAIANRVGPLLSRGLG